MTSQFVQLISVGHYPAKPAGELQIGDTVVWNYGATSTVTGFIKETKKQMVVELTDRYGVHQRRMNKSRLIACEQVLQARMAARAAA